MKVWLSTYSSGLMMAAVLVLASCSLLIAPSSVHVMGSADPPSEEQILRGRQLVITHGCGGCHGGGGNPAAAGWLAGQPTDTIPLGPFLVWPRNITPDIETGLGRYSERQIFNSLRYGLRPSATPDVEIVSAEPGQGRHPETPDYLAPAMPWLFWRYMSDQELWDIAAYLKHGVIPVSSEVPESQAPPDRWASNFTVERIGTHILPSFPTAHEELPSEEKRPQVLSGRQLVAHHACGACHGGALTPADDGWLVGFQGEQRMFSMEFQIGPFLTRPRNVTPDNITGIGRFSERQIFNALRYGLRPGETADVEITSTTPGEGNHPLNPKYLAPPMPWHEYRHLTDRELLAIADYLKHGVKPVTNQVEMSEGPPDFWMSAYAPETIGPFPAPAFPTANERKP